MAGAPDPLDARGDAGRGFDLQHEVHRAHVDAELEGGSCDEPAHAAGLQLVFDEEALFPRYRAMVGAHQLFIGQLVDARGDPLGEAARVDEDDGRAVLADELEQTRIDRGPDAVLAFRAVLILGREASHVLDRDLDRHLHRLQAARVDDRHLAVRSAEEPADLFERPLRRRESDALRLHLRQLAQSLEAQRQVAAALGGRDRVDLVDDKPADGTEDLARGARQDEKQRLRRRDQDVRRVALHRPPDLGRRVAGADRDRDVWRLESLRLHLVADADERRAEVAVDVVRERLQRRHVKDATSLRVDRHRLRRQAVEAPQKRRQGLAAPGRSRHQDVAAGRHLLPAALLDGGRRGEGGAKPVAHRRREEVEYLPHARNVREFWSHKQVFLTCLCSRLARHVPLSLRHVR